MILNESPLIVQFDSGLDQTTIDRLLSINDFEPSQGYNHQRDSASRVKERSSFSYFDSNDSLRSIRRRILHSIDLNIGQHHPLENSEYLQLTKYNVGQEYVAHYDHFNLEGYKNTTKVDRIATALLYLNDGFEGGETFFPTLNIKVFPRQGDILYFEYPPDLANLCIHAGLPVLKGEKRIVSLWIRSAAWPVLD